ncbi:ricin-type beta-trefoil lectin domain protein [Dactylosporangium cerinum]
MRSPKPFSSSSGQSLWSTEAWYTLNAIPGGATVANLALNAPATADSSCTTAEAPAKAVNGTVSGGNSDKWCSNSANKWLQVDLGSSKAVGQIVVRHAGAGREAVANTSNFTLQTSPDGTTWTTRATVTGNTANITTHNLSGVTARYVRFATTDTPYARVYELEVYQQSGPTSGPITGIAGKCLDIDNAGTADGTKIQLWTCNGTAAQRWSRVGSTYQANGKCLDVDNAGTANGTKVQLWTCNGTGSQVWQPQANGSILNPQSGKVLDALGGASADGTQIHIWDYANVASQKWVVPA